MIPYDAHMRPCFQWQEGPLPLAGLPVIGMSCPVCNRDLLSAQCDDFKALPDGSATARCPDCRAKLRQNPEGFVFLDGGSDMVSG